MKKTPFEPVAQSVSGAHPALGAPPESDDRFWRERFTTEPPKLDRLFEYSRRSMPSYLRAEEQLPIHSPLVERLREWSGREGVRASTVICAAWIILAARATEESDICIGVVSPDQPGELFPLRVQVDSMPTRSFILSTARILEGRDARPSMRWQWFLSQIWLKHSSIRPLPFQIAVNLSSPAGPNPALTTLLRKVDATLRIREDTEGLILSIDYDTDVFTPHGILLRLRQLERILGAMCDNPDCDVLEIHFTSSEDEDSYRLINRTDAHYPRDETIDGLFLRQAALTPDRPAILDQDGALSFGDLDRLSSALAAEILRISPHRPTVVGIHLRRRRETVVALLAVMRAGAAYLPLDPSYPPDRLRFMFDDSGAKLLLTRDPVSWAGEAPQLLVSPESVERLTGPVDPLLSSASSPFCVMYTSGSTGRPKGVINTHFATLNCFYWMWEHFPFQEGEVCCQTASLSFGDSIQELFGPLLKGIPVSLISLDILRNPRDLLNRLAEKRVSRIMLVPSLLERLLDSTERLAEVLPYLRLWITSGEALPRSLAERFFAAAPKARLINMYGTSELSNDVTIQEVRSTHIERAFRIPIGRPISNLRIYVVDEKRRLCPIGIPGELLVSGRGTSLGYQSHPELTEDRFVANPFPLGADIPDDHRICYHTGDKVCLRADGELEFIGRMDSQVKIAGKRIELEEVEAVLERHPEVHRAVVALRISPFGIRQIIASIVPRPSATLAADTLNEHCRHLLPDYMVPAMWEIVESLPLTPSGKVDRRRISEQSWSTPGEDAPSAKAEDLSEDENEIMGLWREVLEVSGPLQREQSFFDLGGTSLAMMLLIVKFEKRFDLMLGSKTFFANPTIREMAGALRKARKDISRQEAPVS